MLYKSVTKAIKKNPELNSDFALLDVKDLLFQLILNDSIPISEAICLTCLCSINGSLFSFAHFKRPPLHPLIEPEIEPISFSRAIKATSPVSRFLDYILDMYRKDFPNLKLHYDEKSEIIEDKVSTTEYRLWALRKGLLYEDDFEVIETLFKSWQIGANAVALNSENLKVLIYVLKQGLVTTKDIKSFIESEGLFRDMQGPKTSQKISEVVPFLIGKKLIVKDKERKGFVLNKDAKLINQI